MNEQPEGERYFCNFCKQETKHNLLWQYEKSDEIPEASATEFIIWSIWECMGCETISAKVESGIDWTTDREEQVEFFPRRRQEYATKKRYTNMPASLNAIYEEIIDAFNNDSNMLCAAGLRGLLEGFCVEINPSVSGPNIGFLKKLSALENVVPQNVVKNLHNFHFLGNQALHELKNPGREELALAIEVVEDILGIVYDLDSKTARLYTLIRRMTSSQGT
jgi:hypothetical protein